MEEKTKNKDPEIDRKKDKEKEIIFPPLMCQMLSRHCGYYITSYLGNDLYFLNENVKIMIGYLKAEKGEDWLEKNIPDWNNKKQNINYLSSKLQEVKTWYDTLENKKFDKKEADKITRKFFFKSASKIPLVDQDLYDLFGLLMAKTNLKRQVISSDALKVIEQAGYRTLHLGKRKGQGDQTPQPTPPDSTTNQKDVQTKNNRD